MSKLNAVQSAGESAAGSVWYIEIRPARCRIGLLRRRLADQGIRRVETVTDHVIRCWAEREPALPAEWGCVVARGDEAPAAPLPSVLAGDLVRVRSGPAAGFVGRVQSVRGDRAIVEILVWGKGMAVESSLADMERIGRLPWERGGDG